MNADAGVTLSISCVTFNLDLEVLRLTLESLHASCLHAIDQGLISETKLYLIDNGPDENNLKRLLFLQHSLSSKFENSSVESGHGNVGYGAGHNLAIKKSSAKYHLILNPDVIMHRETIAHCVRYLLDNSHVVMVTPDAFSEDGTRQFISKRMPSTLVLSARLFRRLQKIRYIQRACMRYEYRDLIPTSNPLPIMCASGCFMLASSKTLQAVGGFDEAYFMYFEDFDLSIRLKRFGEIIHYPHAKITHLGGNVGRKGAVHIRYFLSSYFRFLKKKLTGRL